MMIQFHDHYWFRDFQLAPQVFHHFTLCECWIAIATTVVRAAVAAGPIDHGEERLLVFVRILRYSFLLVLSNISVGTNAQELGWLSQVGVPKPICKEVIFATALSSGKHFRVFKF